MAFDFPNNPALGVIYTSPDGDVYTWNGYAWAQGSGAGVATEYVLKSGDSMIAGITPIDGFLTLAWDPVMPMHAATKQYVDIAGIGLPPGGNVGEALVRNNLNIPEWGFPIDGGLY